MLDLDKFQTDTHTFKLVLPNGELSDVEITVRADSHPKVKDVDRKLLLEGEQRRMVRKRRGRQVDDAMTEEDLEYLEEAMLKREVSRVESVKGMSIGGKEIGTDVQLIGEMLDKHEWIKQQIGEQSKDASNFCSK